VGTGDGKGARAGERRGGRWTAGRSSVARRGDRPGKMHLRSIPDQETWAGTGECESCAPCPEAPQYAERAKGDRKIQKSDGYCPLFSNRVDPCPHCGGSPGLGNDNLNEPPIHAGSLRVIPIARPAARNTRAGDRGNETATCAFLFVRESVISRNGCEMPRRCCSEQACHAMPLTCIGGRGHKDGPTARLARGQCLPNLYELRLLSAGVRSSRESTID